MSRGTGDLLKVAIGFGKGISFGIQSACSVSNHKNYIEFNNHSRKVSWTYVGRLTGRKGYSGQFLHPDKTIHCDATTCLTATGSGGICYVSNDGRRHLYIVYSRPTCGSHKIHVYVFNDTVPDWAHLHKMWCRMGKQYKSFSKTFRNSGLSWYYKNTGGKVNDVTIHMYDA